MKQLLVFTIALSIYDTHDPKKVIVEACEQACVKVVVPRADLEDPSLILRLSNLVESQLK